MQVLKYALPPAINGALSEIGMFHENARVLHFDIDRHGNPCIWVLEPDVVVKHPLLERPVRLRAGFFGTGMYVPADLTYYGSCKDGDYIWHAFGKMGPA